MRTITNKPRNPADTAWVRGIVVSLEGVLPWVLDWLCAWRVSLVKNTYPFRQTRIRQSRIGFYVSPVSVISAEPTKPSEILPQIAAGAIGAMDECIARYGALVWTIARRHLSDASEAEDLVQEVFTEIWKKSGSFDPAIASELTFVGMLARRRAIDYLRRIGRRPGFETLDAVAGYAQPEAQVSSVVCDAEAVKASVAALPSDTRQLFHLFFEDGFTHPEIAEKTGLPLGTVKTRLRRGLLVLREQLQRVGASSKGVAS